LVVRHEVPALPVIRPRPELRVFHFILSHWHEAHS
jgi:hypothetical protein